MDSPPLGGMSAPPTLLLPGEARPHARHLLSPRTPWISRSAWGMRQMALPSTSVTPSAKISASSDCSSGRSSGRPSARVAATSARQSTLGRRPRMKLAPAQPPHRRGPRRALNAEGGRPARRRIPWRRQRGQGRERHCQRQRKREKEEGGGGDQKAANVSTARTHEEEDLFTMSFGLPLRDAGDEKCLSILNSVEETISRQLRACKAHALSKKKTLEGLESLQDNPDLEEDYCRALLCRLRFRKHFYHVVMCMRKPHGRGFELARKHVASCLTELNLMLKSQSNITLQQDDENCTTASGCRPVGFDVSLNSRLLSPTPPRAVKVLSWSDAIGYFEKLLHDLDVICASSLDPVLDNVLHFIVQFQKSIPDLVPRAFLQTLLVQDGKLYGQNLFSDVISRALSLPDIIGDKEFQMNEFVVQLGQLVINLLKILCTNTAWQRRKLGKSLQDWSTISIQLELALKREFGETRNVLNNENMCMRVSKQLLIWTQELTYWVASRFLILGFELDLYSANEYCMVYWYMYVVFTKLIEKMQLRALATSENSRRKGKKKRDHSKDSARDTTLSSSCLLLQCYVLLSEGLSMMLAVLRNESMSFQLPTIFNTEQERFMQHFDLLQKARIPEHISYYSFRESASRACISDLLKYNFFKEIQKIIPSLRGSFVSEPEKLAELRRIEQVAEHNRIALNIISQVGAGDRSLRVSFEFIHHPHFAVAAVKRS